jgi:hypothetical protein
MIKKQMNLFAQSVVMVNKMEEEFKAVSNNLDNISFLLSISQRRFDCILRTAEALKQKLKLEV